MGSRAAHSPSPPRAKLLAALSDPATYGCAGPVEVHETHASWVFLAGDEAYKVKKPVQLAFLDYGTPARRLAACRAELEVNRELAPSVYRRVIAIVPDGGRMRLAPEAARGAVEHALVMRRFDERGTLASTLAAGRCTDGDLDRLARRLAGFHRDAPRRAGGAAAALRSWQVNLDQFPAALPAELEEARRFAEAFVCAHGEELDDRARRGLVRDCHGDLRCEHVLIEEPIEIVDRIEFDPELRAVDVGCDLAFLLMDLEARGHSGAAVRLLRAYRQAGGEPGSDELVRFFAAHWALVRAKVALLAAEQRELYDTGEARALLALSARLRWRARGPLALVLAGPPASGKSTLADELARRYRVAVVSSDRVRKQLAGLAPWARASPAVYEPAFTARTYRALGREAAAVRATGAPVVIDATCSTVEHRAELLRGLGGEDERMLFAECRVPEAVAAARAAGRLHEPDRVSDATPEIAARLAAGYEPVRELARAGVVEIDSCSPLETQLGAIGAAADARLAEGQ